jgi:hypothetical protein
MGTQAKHPFFSFCPAKKGFPKTSGRACVVGAGIEPSPRRVVFSLRPQSRIREPSFPAGA